ncbi:MAG: MmgE/PrpD family protein [Betaproteobacteria bacterium]
MSSLDLQLAEHAASVRFENLSAAAIERAKIFTLDTIGVGIAGGSTPEIAPLLQAVQGWGDTQEVGLWGTRRKLSPGQAVLLNAYQIHCQEFDCLHEGAVLHAMATLLPVLLTESQVRGGVTGKALIAALAAGVDVACTIGLASKQGLRFFRPATSGGFGAVAGLANLRGFDAQRTLAAFGHQLAQVSGTMQGHTEGSVVLPLQVGMNARAALQSCDLAQSGFPSLQLPLTGRFGYLPMFETEWDLEPPMKALGEIWRIAELSHKPYPSGRATHGGIEGLMVLRDQHGFQPEEIEQIIVHGPSLINHLVNRPPVQSPSPNYARLCMPFALAKVLQHGSLDPMHFRGEALHDPQTFVLSQKVSMQIDDNPNPNALAPQRVSVRLKDRRVLEHSIDTMLASPRRPLSEEARMKKFQRCWSLAAESMGDSAELLTLINGLERCDDVRTVTDQLAART